MSTVFTEKWQRQVRQKIIEKTAVSVFLICSLKKQFREADKFRQWLKEDSQRIQILQYLAYEQLLPSGITFCVYRSIVRY
jgi:hypothetical protein